MSPELEDLIARLAGPKVPGIANAGARAVMECDLQHAAETIREQADEIERLKSDVTDFCEAATIEATRVGELEQVMGVIAMGDVGPEREGHYLAHREAVRLAREALASDPNENRDVSL